MPQIAGYDVKKLLDRHPIKCLACLNKIAYENGQTLNDHNKNRIPCNTSCIDLRDEGGLRCPSTIIVMFTRIIIKLSDFFLNSEELMNDYHKSCSILRVTLLTFKEMGHEMLCE